MDFIEIIDYEDRYQPAFKELNLEWLDLYHLTEQIDIDMLSDPRKNILDGGGFICLARFQNQIIGSAALINEHDGVYELAKMAVAKNFRNQGLSKLLLEKCLAKAKELQAKKIVLFSSHKLQAALGLYEKYGFRYIPMKDSPFLTADIKMELNL